MKYTIITLTALASPALAMAGQTCDPVAPSPTPAACNGSWSVEVAASHRWATKNLLKSAGLSAEAGKQTLSGTIAAPGMKVDTNGVDITLVRNLSKRHSVNIRLGYATGDDCLTLGSGTIKSINSALGVPAGLESLTAKMNGAHASARIHNLSLMPGYRFTQTLTPRTSVYVGANVGIACTSIKGAISKEPYTAEGIAAGHHYQSNPHDSAFGFAYSLEAGVRYALAENVEVFAAYEFSGSSARPALDGTIGSESATAKAHLTTRRQAYNGIRLGLSRNF